METQNEYQAFPLPIFRGHVYQQNRRIREEPGWVAVRNKKARKIHEDEVDAMKDELDLKEHTEK